MASITRHKLQRVLVWLCGNSILGLCHIDEIMVTKTMVEMTNCYFECYIIIVT